MDFNNIFKVLLGKANEIDKPIFKKPYTDKTAEMLELARRLDTAPEASKPLFRAAIESLAARTKSHKEVHDLLENSKLPILILYDIHIFSPAGSAAIDYIVLSNRFILTLACPIREDILTAEESRAVSSPGEHYHFSGSEHAAHVVTETLKADRLLKNKDLSMVWPLTVISETGDKTFTEPLESFPSAQSPVYPEIHRAQTIKPEELIAYLTNLFKFDKDFTSWLSNNDLMEIANKLLAYDQAVDANGTGPKG